MSEPDLTRFQAPVDHIDHFQRRVMQDALLDGTAVYWRRRADTFEWARPRPGDYLGRATADEVAARDARLAEAAEACRKRGAVALVDEWGVAA